MMTNRPTPTSRASRLARSATRSAALATVLAAGVPAALPAALPTVLTVAAGTALALQAGLAGADDTEVYFGQVDPDADTNPNVLFVLDTSGSMSEKDGGETTRMTRMKKAFSDLMDQATNLNAGLMRFNSKNGGGPVLYPVRNIDDPLCTGPGCAANQVTVTVPIREGADDVEEYITDPDIAGRNDVLVSGSLFELIKTNRGEQVIGLRFTDVKVPRGATIVDARLELSSLRKASSGGVTIDVRSEASGDAAPFSGQKEGVSSRDWDPFWKKNWPLGDWKKDENYSSTNLADIVQRVTDRSDWCGGNALALKLENGFGSTPQTQHQARTFESATSGGSDDQKTARTPTLRVTYKLDSLLPTEGCMRRSTTHQVVAADDDAEEYLDDNSMLINGVRLDVPRQGGRLQKVGVRFQNVAVPKDAKIRGAWIDFHVHSQKSDGEADPVDVYISGQNRANNGPFTTNPEHRVSSREVTSERILWRDVPNEIAGAVVRTPDIAPVIQSIVERQKWVEDEKAAVIILDHASGDGERAFVSFEHASAQAPRLTIEYEDPDGAGTLTAGGTLVQQRKVRDELVRLVDSFVPNGATPMVGALWEASQYFRGENVEYGKKRGSSNMEYNRISHPLTYTGGTPRRPGGCRDDNLNAENCKGERIDGNPVYTAPITSSCQTNHIVFLSDGQANSNSAAQRIRSLTGKSSCKADGNNNEACGVELARWLYDNDLSDTVGNRQNVRTHTIAFNLDDPEFLQELANEGGGKLYRASDSDELLSSFRRIIDDAGAIDTSFAAPGATVNQFNRLTHRDDIYFAMFKPISSPRWSGNLKRFRIGKKASETPGGEKTGEVLVRDRNGDRAVDEDTGFFSEDAYSFWPETDDAGTVKTTPDGHDVTRGGAANRMALDGLAGIGERRTYTWVGDAAEVPSGGVELTAEAQKLHEDNTAISASVLGLGNVDADERDAYRSRLLAWARGVDVLNEDGDDSTEDARRHMGDPMHARPVIVNYTKDEDDASADAGTDADINADPDGEADEEDDVRSIVFAATNEGYLHAIDAATGEEQFAFMPGELLDNLRIQFDDNAADPHPYGLDGQLSVWRSDTNDDYVVDEGEKAYLFVGMRRGGGSYYALDVSTLDEPKLLWAIRGGEGGSTGFGELGQTWSRMTPVRMRINGQNQDVLLFAGGYDEEQDGSQVESSTAADASGGQRGRGIFIVEVETGELLWSGLGASGGSQPSGSSSQRFTDMKYPLAGNLRAIDIDRDGLVDQIYAADTGGQLWRFDPKQDHSSGDLMEGGVIADFSGTAIAEERRFYAEPDVALIEDGGERFLTVSIGSGWRAHPLHDDVEDRFYVVRQKNVRKAPGAGRYGIDDDGVFRPLTDSDLVAVADTLDPSVNEHGWYLDFARRGEKVLGASTTFDNSVIFSSYVPQPAVNDCSTGIGGGRAYVLDVVSGAPKRNLDGKDEPELERSVELKHGGLPPDAMILITEDGDDEPEILFGGEQLDAGILNATRRTFWSDRGKGPIVVSADEE